MDATTWDRIADDYLAHIVSPFDAGTANPLLDELTALPRARRGRVADIGCGGGALLPFLSDKFNSVTAIDFSREMLRQARAGVDATNVSFRRADMRDLSRFRGKFDVAVAVNSVLAPSPRRVNRALSEIRRTLRPGGLFFGIFPAMDSVLYHAMLVLERESEEHSTDPPALRHTREICERSKYDFMTGVFDDNGDRQKHYYRFELRHRLHKAGFVKLRFRKVRYPWDESVSGYELFPGQPKLWDWLVCAQRPAL
jgi:SAM-dependent methyltransferase